MDMTGQLDELLPSYSKELEDFLPHVDDLTQQETLTSLLPKAYEELRQVASRQLRRQRHISFQTTALVNEACLRLMESRTLDIRNRRQFFYWAARTMRHLLVERARRRGSLKRGGDRGHVTIDETIQLPMAQPSRWGGSFPSTRPWNVWKNVTRDSAVLSSCAFLPA